MKRMQRSIVALLVAGALSLGLAGLATAQRQAGLVNVNVGDVEILNDVSVGVAAQVAANICGVEVGPVVLLGVSVVREGGSVLICETDQGDVTISQD